MTGKTLLKVYMGRICFCAILLLCAACSREQEEDYQAPCADQEEEVDQQVLENSDTADRQDEQGSEGPDDLYKDPYANPNDKVGQQIAESFEPDVLHEGRYSVYSYEFNGKGPAHKMSDVRKYGLDHTGSRGSDVSVKVHIEWPEERSGLTKDALAKVRKAILWMNFVAVPMTCPYVSPEALGETQETLEKRNKELWAEEGEDRDLEGFGLQPADWATLCCGALSYETGRLPAKDDGRVTTKSLELGLADIKAHAQACYKCELPEKMDDSWWHCCSQWSYDVDQHIDMPFGLTTKENSKWYERPVLSVWVDGYDNDGGNGCHSKYCSKVYSLPDGIELDLKDYFAARKLKKLSAFVTKRLCKELLEGDEAKERSKYPLDLEEAYMLVSKEGVKWTWGAYSILPGCYGTPSVFIKWEELESFK